MKAKHLIILAVIAIITICATLYLSHESAPADSTAVGGQLLPDLKPQIKNVAKISIERHQEPAVTLLRNEAGWVFSEQSGYFADTTQIRKLILDLADIPLLEEKTSKPEFYIRLGVEDIKTTPGEAVLVSLFDDKGATLASLVIGKYSVRTGTYVRRTDQKKTWLTKKKLMIPEHNSEWLDRHPLNIAAEKIASITISPAGSESYTLRRTDKESTFTFNSEPDNYSLKSERTTENLSKLLTELRIDNVSVKPQDWDRSAANSAVFTLFDGTLISLFTKSDDDGKHLLEIAIDISNAPEPGADSVRVDGWLFEISDATHGKLSKPLSEIAELKTQTEPDKPAGQ